MKYTTVCGGPVACLPRGRGAALWMVLLAGLMWLSTACDAQPYTWLKSRWKPDHYVHIEHGAAQAGPIQPGWWSAMWIVEPVPGSYFHRLRNRWKPDQYLHIEYGPVQAGAIQPGWWSAMWIVEPVSGTQFRRLRNRWKPDLYLHIEYGGLQAGAIQPGWHSAMWLLDFAPPSAGASAPASAPVPAPVQAAIPADNPGPQAGIAQAGDLESFRRQSLSVHNALRAQHGAPPLVLDAALNELAQQWAQHLASTGRMAHRPNSRVGENVYMMWSTQRQFDVDGAGPVQSWYGEVKYYNYDNPRFSMQTGHFTQVVWQDSRRLGCGKASAGDGKVFVVCNYDPPGNVQGRFAQNVQPAR